MTGRRASALTGLGPRIAARLTPDRLLVYPAVVIVLFVVVWGVSLRSAVPLPDYLARWTAGGMVLDGQVSDLYDPAAQSRIQADMGATRLSWFVSPPYVALLFAPLAALPYPVSAAVWTLVSVALLVWSARTASGLHPRLARLGTPTGMLVAGSCQPVLELVGGGQDTALVLAALVLGAKWLSQGRGLAAGLALGVGAVKPQLVVLVPVLLLMLRQWRALLGFVVSCAIAATAATLALGPQVWLDWRGVLTSALYTTEVQAAQAWKNDSMYGLVASLVPAPSIVVVLWVVLAGAVVVLTIKAWPHLKDTGPVSLLLVTTPLVTVLVSPHAMVYDLVLLVPAVAFLCAQPAAAHVRALAAVAYVLLFLAPLLHLAGERIVWFTPLAAPWTVLVIFALWRHHMGTGRGELGEAEAGPHSSDWRTR